MVPSGSKMVILAQPGVEERQKSIVRKFRGKTLRNLEVSHVVGNPLSRTDVKQALMTCAEGAGRGSVQRVVIVADRDWLAGPSTDKRTIFAAMLAESVCEDAGVVSDSMVAEVVDRSLGQQVKATHPTVGYISSAELMALFTSQVVEHEDLNGVWCACGVVVLWCGVQAPATRVDSPDLVSVVTFSGTHGGLLSDLPMFLLCLYNASKARASQRDGL